MKMRCLNTFLVLNFWTIVGVSCHYSELFEKNVLKTVKEILIEEVKSVNQSEVIQKSLHSHRNYDNGLCLVQLLAVTDDLLARGDWALPLIDSWGKLPSGLLKGRNIDYGAYDECIEIYKDTETNVGVIKGQYCLATLHFVQSSLEKNFYHKSSLNSKGSFSFQLGICIPNTCDPEFFTDSIFKQTNLFDLPVNVSFPYECKESKDTEFRPIDIFAISLFSFIGFLMVISTVYDITMMKLEKRKNLNLIAFSVYTNGEKIFKCSKSNSPNVMDCLNGIRVLSIAWVVILHSYTAYTIAIVNPMDVRTWTKTLYSQLIQSGTISVDSFFLLSGLLVCWSLLRHLDQNNGKVNIFSLYLHRYLRLTPALAAAVLFDVTVFTLITNGPGYSKNISCDKNWWSTLLYVQNYVNPSERCIGQAWYLAADMQLFILSPFLIYPLWRWRENFLPAIFVIIFLSIACVFTTVTVNEYKVAMSIISDSNIMDRMSKIYFPTHTRLGVWCIGVVLGFLLHKYKGKTVALPKAAVIAGWVIAPVSMLAVVFGMYDINQLDNQTTVLQNALFESLSRVTWGVSVSWIIFACVHGYGGPVNWFLSWPQWQPLAKLSYSIYIIHVPVQFYFLGNLRAMAHFTDISAIHTFWGDFGLCCTIAVIWTLAFELPIIILETNLLKRKSFKAKETNKETNNGKEAS